VYPVVFNGAGGCSFEIQFLKYTFAAIGLSLWTIIGTEGIEFLGERNV
jgi:hypothetical protein